jgi:hypothetical protein
METYVTTRNITGLPDTSVVELVSLTVQRVQAMRRALVDTGNARSARGHASAVVLALVRSSNAANGTGTRGSTAHTDGLLDLLPDGLLGAVGLVLLASDTVDLFVRGGGRRVGTSSSQTFTGQAASGGAAQARVVCSSRGVVRSGGGGLAADARAECARDGVGVAVCAGTDEVSRGVLERFLHRESA